ncbi:MAG: hypothetical protein V1736_04575 [Pseudomonadota bacterium]
MGEAGLFDEFFYFLDHFGFDKLFAKLNPKNKKRESKVPFIGVLYIYLMRIITGLPFFWHIDPVILHSQSLMRIVGFNGREVREGTCSRGARKKTTDPEKSEQTPDNEADQNSEQPTEIRGPVCPEFIAGHICAILAQALEKLFNQTITILAANNFFPKKIHALLDVSEIQPRLFSCTSLAIPRDSAVKLRRQISTLPFDLFPIPSSLFGCLLLILPCVGSTIPCHPPKVTTEIRMSVECRLYGPPYVPVRSAAYVKHPERTFLLDK